GYVNTELRSLNEPRVFDYFDYVCLDDGERPILAVLEQLKSKKGPLLRTYVREGTKVVFKTDESLHDIPQKLVGVPTYDGLDLRSYISLFEMLNPMHRIWSDGRWNKLTLAHGCYWKKCSFCDTSLDYIGRYDPASADMILDRIEKIITETGQTGFHFVDEAAPPALLRALAEKLIERRVQITWWGNIRFERNFNPELTALLAKSGCIAVTGGLEVASDRLLKLMKKGVTVEQVARVTRAFADAGVLVHAYLMYGFPTQTEQETIDSLERVRQLFLEGCLQSAFWHRFSVTAHSPIGKDPKAYGIELLPEPAVTFARNDLLFFDSSDVDHDGLGHGLNRALYNYMHGVGLGDDVRKWFKRKVPKAKVARNLVRNAIKK
ncbi:MAG: radical SAM protein, partial [Bdellovibrionota bacterium]